ncbi:MAG TPA: hypothetical protein VGS60_12510 [Actinomycetes bacterium]|nr:hypothetical protein [Actinomycetes bacterium]
MSALTEQVQVAVELGDRAVADRPEHGMQPSLPIQGPGRLLDSLACLSNRRPRRVDVSDRLNGMLETAGGRLDCSLLELATAVASDVETARRAVAALDPIDHVLSVDILNAPAEERFSIEWAPVTSVVDVLLDWDLLTVDITVSELSEWLGVPHAVAGRALSWLAVTPGVAVRGWGDEAGTVSIAVALERCPLTAEVPAAG